MSSQNAREIAERMLKSTYYYGIEIETLALAYLELLSSHEGLTETYEAIKFDRDATEKVYRMNRQYVEDAKSEIAKLKEENAELKFRLEGLDK